MVLLLGSLVLGFVVARLSVLPKGWHRQVSYIGSVALILLLFSMGLSLGTNAEILDALPSLGLKALFLGLGTILGSVFLVWLVLHVVRRQEK